MTPTRIDGAGASLRAGEVLLRWSGDHPRDLEIESSGASPLASFLSLIQYGDYLSTFVAMETGADPVPVATIEELKSRPS